MLKTLLVEDNVQFRQAFKQMLSDLFPAMVMEEAGDGKEAMEKLDSFCPGLIFMDIRLPDESGLQLTKKITAKYPGINVVMLTSYDLPEYRKAAATYGASHYLVKGSADSREIEGLVKPLLEE